MLRIRIHYAKTSPLRYTGNLDIHKIWERIFRRAKLPLAYSQGFHPQPRINQAAPLPLGLTSQAELIEIWLEEDLPLEQIQAAIVQVAPPGIEIQEIETIDLKSPSLPTLVQQTVYQALILDPIDRVDLQSRIDQLLTSAEVVRQRRGKTYDLRPLVLDLKLSSDDTVSQPMIWMQLSGRDGATGRPDEVIAALGLDPFATRIERLQISM